MASTAEHSQLSRPLAPALAVRHTVTVLAGSLFIAACAHIAVPLPFTPVPMTLQPFAVVLLGLLLGPALSAATCAAYLLEGAVGLPVFTPQGPGGIAQLLGFTGGYLLSYPAAAAVAGALSRLSLGGRALRNLGTAFLGAAAANLLILSAGACWLGMLTHHGLSLVYQTAVLPFLGEDALKVVLAALIATGWQRYRARFDQIHKPGPA
jgi:biotin transport system substrate-specific component